MNLFDDIALFDGRTRRFNDFRLPDADLQLWEQFFTRAESDHYFKVLLGTTPWQQRIRKMYDKMVCDPRLIAYYGGANGHEWTQDLLAIKAKVQDQCGVVF